MIVGDFVKLSAYGKTLKGNKRLHSLFGVVVEAHTLLYSREFYFVYWLDGDRTISTRRELKYLN